MRTVVMRDGARSGPVSGLRLFEKLYKMFHRGEDPGDLPSAKRRFQALRLVVARQLWRQVEIESKGVSGFHREF